LSNPSNRYSNVARRDPEETPGDQEPRDEHAGDQGEDKGGNEGGKEDASEATDDELAELEDLRARLAEMEEDQQKILDDVRSKDDQIKATRAEVEQERSSRGALSDRLRAVEESAKELEKGKMALMRQYTAQGKELETKSKELEQKTKIIEERLGDVQEMEQRNDAEFEKDQQRIGKLRTRAVHLSQETGAFRSAFGNLKAQAREAGLDVEKMTFREVLDCMMTLKLVDQMGGSHDRGETDESRSLRDQLERERRDREELKARVEKMEREKEDDRRRSQEEAREERWEGFAQALLEDQKKLVARVDGYIADDGNRADPIENFMKEADALKSRYEKLRTFFSDGKEPDKAARMERMAEKFFGTLDQGLQTVTQMATRGSAAATSGLPPPRRPFAGQPQQRNPATWRPATEFTQITEEEFQHVSRGMVDREGHTFTGPDTTKEGLVFVPPLYFNEAKAALGSNQVPFFEYNGWIVTHPRDFARASPLIEAIPLKEGPK
jgi:hypothetical protein